VLLFRYCCYGFVDGRFGILFLSYFVVVKNDTFKYVVAITPPMVNKKTIGISMATGIVIAGLGLAVWYQSKLKQYEDAINNNLVKPAVEYCDQDFIADSVKFIEPSIGSTLGDLVTFPKVEYSAPGITTAFENVSVGKDLSVSVQSNKYRQAIMDSIKTHVESRGFTYDPKKVIFTYPADPYPGEKGQDSIYFKVFYNDSTFNSRSGNFIDTYIVKKDSTGKLDAIGTHPE
jgi:hypothetical protein